MFLSGIPFRTEQHMQGVAYCLARAGIAVREDPNRIMLHAELEGYKNKDGYFIMLRNGQDAETVMQIMLDDGYTVRCFMNRWLYFWLPDD